MAADPFKGATITLFLLIVASLLAVTLSAVIVLIS
jgi:hypothetical protein